VPDFLRPEIKNKSHELSRIFADARPFRHIVIDNFFESGFWERLNSEFPAFDQRKAINEMGIAGRKAVVSNVATIGPGYREFDQLMRDRTFLEFMGRIAGIERLLYDPEYLGGGTHENLDGQDLDLHVDFNYHPTGHLHRRLNLIVFLNPEWFASWGGCLELHRDPWNVTEGDVTIVPIANRAVLFETTESSWHGFTRITLPPEKQHLSRRSLAVYFYTRDRPAEQTAHSHGTVYVPRALPEHLEAGYMLQPADVENLQVLIARRDAQIRFLYERELEFSEALFGITRSPSFQVGRFLTWPARKVRALLSERSAPRRSD
jgi:hypothetical protein